MKIELLDFQDFGSSEHLWFHPAVTRLDDGRWLATMQKINGSDHYAAPAFAVSNDEGKTWSAPEEIPAFQSRALPCTPFAEGVADVRPFTMPDGTVAAFGCTTFYTTRGCASWDREVAVEPPQGRAVYALWSPESGTWGTRATLELPGVERSYRTACTQAVLRGEDEVVLPIYLDSGVSCDYFRHRSARFASLTAIYRKRGEGFEFSAKSNLLEIPVLRGCIEPSALRLPEGGYAMTLRAEDGRMYRALSDDALAWRDLRSWRWDDGNTITTDSTQQHWLTLGKRVYLVYTRSDGSNDAVMRFRAPLYIAEADAGRGLLFRASERVVFPRRNVNGVEVLYGNFHCVQLGEDRALVTDSELYTEVRDDVMTHTETRVMAALVTP